MERRSLDLKGKSEADKAVIKAQLDWLHLRKIDMADVVIILKTSGEELGTSTQKEKEYAVFKNRYRSDCSRSV